MPARQYVARTTRRQLTCTSRMMCLHSNMFSNGIFRTAVRLAMPALPAHAAAMWHSRMHIICCAERAAGISGQATAPRRPCSADAAPVQGRHPCPCKAAHWRWLTKASALNILLNCAMCGGATPCGLALGAHAAERSPASMQQRALVLLPPEPAHAGLAMARPHKQLPSSKPATLADDAAVVVASVTLTTIHLAVSWQHRRGRGQEVYHVD
jgi:hypothetical protein